MVENKDCVDMVEESPALSTARRFHAHLLNSIEEQSVPQSRSKRKDGLSEDQVMTIYKAVNQFFTLKWPSIVALLATDN